MKLSNIINNAYRRCGLSGTLIFTLIVLASSPALGMTQVGLYDVWETQVTNSKTYSNPFDFNVIELRATFTSPSGSKISFFGFYDGNGNGGQTGNVWKLRFMPDKVGTWNYTYTWTDGTPGGSGSFKVVDTGLPGPLKVATDNSSYFMTSGGKPFDFRGYDMHILIRHRSNKSLIANLSWIKGLLQTNVINQGYNFIMLDGLIDRVDKNAGGFAVAESWWKNTTDKKRFNVAAWRAYEDVLNMAKADKVYVMLFAGMIRQGDHYGYNDFKVFLRYWVARFGAFYNFFGWSPTWEWMDIWGSSEVNQIMQQVQAWDPFPRLLTSHDCSNSNFSNWLDFSMRQGGGIGPIRTVFAGNVRTGFQQAGCNVPGVGFPDKPIIGSEDIWENPSGTTSGPRNKTEVRRGAWGIQMAGVMPLYSEWNPSLGGNGAGKPEVRRMFDFFYSKTQYRQYKQLNQLVSSSSRQIASGIDGQEYLVYDENGGSITINLSGTSSSTIFSVLWYDPKTGVQNNGASVNGGASRTLQSPFSGDTVLLLTKTAVDTKAPTQPTGLLVR